MLVRHRTIFPDEASYVRRAHGFVLAHDNGLSRDLFPTHMTASSWVINPMHNRVLLLLHRKSGLWLQPGGHFDDDMDIIDVALRETAEETGLDPDEIRPLSPSIFDVDIHEVPPDTSAPRHEHIDLRFLVQIDDRIDIHGNEESLQVSWVGLRDALRFNNSRSIFRMVEKTRRIRRHLPAGNAGTIPPPNPGPASHRLTPSRAAGPTTSGVPRITARTTIG